MNQPLNIFSFLQKYQQLQNGIMYDEMINLGFASIGYSIIDTSTYWNIALINSLLTNEQINGIEKKFKTINRKPTFYFENKLSLNDFVVKIKNYGYKKDYEDCFQFWKEDEINKTHFENIKKVSNSTELKVFLDTFNKCYQNNDPQNPYGELGNYLKVAENVWYKHQTSNRLEYFIVYNKNIPVAVSTLTNYGDIGYISNVGSLQTVRGKGFGKAATLYCVQQSIKNSNLQHCLATEEDHYPNEFYKRIGFATKFSAVGYTK